MQERSDAPTIKKARDTLSTKESLFNFINFALALKDEEFWHKLKRHNPNIIQLKNFWLHQKEKAHFTTETLYKTDDILQLLHNISGKTLQKIPNSWARQCPEEAEAYTAYLSNIEIIVTEERQKIAETLYFRLKTVLKTGRCNAHNPMAYLMEEFNRRHIEAANKHADNVFFKHPDTPIDSAKALAYIKTYGSEQLNDLVRTNLVLNINRQPLLLRQQKEKAFFIPEPLASLIPERLGLFGWLFRGLNFRYRFFQKKSQLLFNMAMLTQAEIKAESVYDFDNHCWRNLYQLQADLFQEQ